MAPEPRWITSQVLHLLYQRQMELFGGRAGVLDENVVQSALARAQNLHAYVRDADLFDLAAAYLCGFTQRQGFTDGNKRIGVAAALVFLRINGVPLHVPPAELYALAMQAARHEIDEAGVAAWMRARAGRTAGPPGVIAG
jgi:death-on-curing protein